MSECYIERYGLPATRLTLTPDFSVEAKDYTMIDEVVHVRFEGDIAPRPFRGEGRYREWSLAVAYNRDQWDHAKELLDLLDEAAAAADSRLTFCPGDRMEELVTTEVGSASAPSVSRVPVAGIVKVSFKFTEVHH